MDEGLNQVELQEYLRNMSRSPPRNMNLANLIAQFQMSCIEYGAAKQEAIANVALDRLNELREELIRRVR